MWREHYRRLSARTSAKRRRSKIIALRPQGKSTLPKHPSSVKGIITTCQDPTLHLLHRIHDRWRGVHLLAQPVIGIVHLPPNNRRQLSKILLNMVRVYQSTCGILGRLPGLGKRQLNQLMGLLDKNGTMRNAESSLKMVRAKRETDEAGLSSLVHPHTSI